ncbi:MAG: glycosyltransferase family 4 protein [Polyangiaceae bacterium]
MEDGVRSTPDRESSRSARRARTLIVSLSYPAEEGDPSGHFVRTEALDLVRAGEDVHVIAPRVTAGDSARYRSSALGGDALFRWPGAIARARANPLRLAAIPGVALRVRRAIARAGRFDRVRLHWLVPTAWPLTPAFPGADVEATAHGADVRMLLAAPMRARERILTAILDRGARIRFVAHALLDALADGLAGVTRARLVARARVEPMALESMDHVAPRDARGGYVVWVGRDIPSKRLDVALDACARAGRRLVVVGAARAARDGVRFLGKVPRDEALAWIAGADALLSTSLAEGAPTSVREARAIGVPVIACPAGDLARWAESDGGIAIAPIDAAGIGALVGRPLPL